MTLEGLRLGPEVDADSDIWTVIAGAAATHPDAPAVRDAQSSLTHTQLGELAGRQAVALQAAGVRPGDVVVIEVPRSVREVVAILGVLRAGAAYTAIDPGAPAARAERMLARCRPTAVIGDSDRARTLAALAPSECPVVPAAPCEDETTGAAPRGTCPSLTLDPEAPAYVAFTSGSTGEPKAVVVPHRAVVRLVRGSAHYLRQGPQERFLRLAPLAFDASTLEVFASLAAGSSLEVFPPGPVAPLELASFLQERRVTVAWLTAGLFRLVAQEAPQAFDGLSQLLTGGDVVPAAQARAVLARRGGELTLTNGYGPTESTTFTTTFSVHRAEDVPDVLPIGHPVAGTQVLVLDGDLRPVRDGQSGELCVGGSGLATGYLGAAEETERAFVSPPEHGGRLYRTGDLVQWGPQGLDFLGRIDRQVKVRGHRVELSEIEAALRADARVLDAAVTTSVAQDQPTLVGVYVPANPGTEADVLRQGLRDQLPDYMVPIVLLEVASLPLSPNGKIDSAAVRALVDAAEPASASGPPAAAAHGGPAADLGEDVDYEALVAGLWAEVLGHDDFDHDEGFFDVGGDSLLAASLHTRVCAVFPHLGVRVVDIFRHPTVQELAEHLRTKAAS